MPRIDPLQLLNCLKVLLSENGGIGNPKDVTRVASLMNKYSKKLVSKSIYIQILKSTNTDLLENFMGVGGWDLVYGWLVDAVSKANWDLTQEILELFLLCPVDTTRLKSNAAPKIVKNLCTSAGSSVVNHLASKLVDQWLQIVKAQTPATPAVRKPEKADTTISSTTEVLKSPSVNGSDEVDEAKKESSKKEKRDREKDRSSKSSSSSSSSSRHKSSSSSSSSKSKSSSSSSSSSKDKDRHRSSSSKSSSRDKDREKDKDRHSSSSKHRSSSSSSSSSKHKSEKSEKSSEKSEKSSDREKLLEKLAKIPKKPSTEATDEQTSITVPSKKASISIEIKKDTDKSSAVKTYKSTFRSHGLTEEAPPPPSRKGLKKPAGSTTTPAVSSPTTLPGGSLASLKRPSPPKDTVAEKRPKLDIISTTAPEKAGGVKLIAPKAKRKFDGKDCTNLFFFIFFRISSFL